MTRRGRVKPADRSEAEGYRQQAIDYLKSARTLADLADSRLGNSIAVLVVHGAIAWTDALCIAYGGKKSIGDHDEAPGLLETILGKLAAPAKITTLRSIDGRKDKVSYTGTTFSLTEAATLLRKAERYADWADALYQRRPPNR